ncbi:deoxycytidyl transferase [Bonamia ostreae]|uniref:Deoxycytidyl transferase n=1 Tax=Bonamia ostreae TaxID=126728 RepID=A0ABV2AL49_9EUKA
MAYYKNRFEELDRIGDLPTETFNKRFNNSKSIGNTDIFRNVKIYVNGYCQPPQSEIHRMVKTHGGNISFYYSRKVTHVVSQNFGTRLKKFRSSVIVKPSWITESVKNNRKLPICEFTFLPKTNILSYFKSVKSPRNCEKRVLGKLSKKSVESKNNVENKNFVNFGEIKDFLFRQKNLNSILKALEHFKTDKKAISDFKEFLQICNENDLLDQINSQF